jgi:hypothetical protein
VNAFVEGSDDKSMTPSAFGFRGGGSGGELGSVRGLNGFRPALESASTTSARDQGTVAAGCSWAVAGAAIALRCSGARGAVIFDPAGGGMPTFWCSLSG